MESFSKCSLEVVISDSVLPGIQEFIEFIPGARKKVGPHVNTGLHLFGF